MNLHVLVIDGKGVEAVGILVHILHQHRAHISKIHRGEDEYILSLARSWSISLEKNL